MDANNPIFMTLSANPAKHLSQWIPLSDRNPEPQDALVYKISTGSSAEWLGSVIGLYLGREIPCLVLATPGGICLAPMVENGVDLCSHVTHWMPWPKAPMSMPTQSAQEGAAAISSQHNVISEPAAHGSVDQSQASSSVDKAQDAVHGAAGTMPEHQDRGSTCGSAHGCGTNSCGESCAARPITEDGSVGSKSCVGCSDCSVGAGKAAD